MLGTPEHKGPPPFLAVLILGAVSSFLLLAHGGNQSLIGADEGFYAQMAREMVQSGQWLAPTFLGSPFFEKPPLIQWLMALSYQLGGINEFTTRAPSWLPGILTVVLTYALGRSWVGGRLAFWGALTLPATYLWLSYGRVGNQDMLLTALELLGLWGLIQGSKSRPWALLWGLAIGLGLLLKSAMILLSVIAVLPYLIFENRRHRLLQNPYLYLGLGLGLTMFGLWLWAAYQGYGDQVFKGLFGKLTDLGSKEFHQVDPLYYFWNLPVNTFPWGVLALGGLIVAFRKGSLLLWSYPVIFFALLQVYATKTPYYLLQITPFVALLATLGLDQLRADSARWVALGLLLLSLALLGTAGAVVVNPSLIPEAQPYVPLAFVLGALWCLPLIIWSARRWLSSWRDYWQATVIMGPMITLVVALFVTNIGNYSPAFKAYCQTQWPAELTGPVDLVYDSDPGRVSEFIALAFYTPNPGEDLKSGALIQGQGHGVWWLSPEVRQKLVAQQFPMEELARVDGWSLARAYPATKPNTTSPNPKTALAMAP